MRGSWGEEVIECRWDEEEGKLCADLPSLSPGVYHYNFLINGSQVIHFGIHSVKCCLSVL